MIKTVILNGPPGSGKDTIANLLVEQTEAIKQEFKAALYKETAKHYGVNLSAFTLLATDRLAKDNLKHSFGAKFNITPRNALIHVSEDIIKPIHGLSYFGERAAESLTEGLNVFSDGGGWWEELDPVAKASDVTIIFRLYRDGFDFYGDSRHYYSKINKPKSLKGVRRIKNIILKENQPQKAVDYIKDHIQA